MEMYEEHGDAPRRCIKPYVADVRDVCNRCMIGSCFVISMGGG